MTINTGIPTNIRRPATFHSFLYSTGGRSLVPLDKRITLVGIKSAAGTLAVATPTEVFDTTEVDGLAGRGSELALMYRAAVAQAAREGRCPRIFIEAIDAPGASVAAASTLTFAGTATANGTIRLRIAGRLVSVGVAADEAAATVAARVESAIDALVDILPVTAGVVGAVVTCTHVTTSTNGNDVKYRTEATVPGITITIAQSAAGTGTVDLSTSLDALAGQKFDGIAVANGDANDVSDLLAHLTTTTSATSKRWRRVFMFEPGTIGAATTHAGSFNHVGAHVLSGEQFESLPGELAAAACVAFNCASRPNANFNRHKLVGYACPAQYAYTETEIETALAVGVTPLAPVVTGNGAFVDGLVQITKLTTTKTLEGAQPVEWPRIPAVSEVGWYLAQQLDAKYEERFGPEANPEGALVDDEVDERLRDMWADVLYAAQAQKIVKQADDCLPLAQFEANATLAYRRDADLAYVPVVPLDQVAFVHRVTQQIQLGN